MIPNVRQSGINTPLQTMLGEKATLKLHSGGLKNWIAAPLNIWQKPEI